jgi:ribonuclease D
MLITDSAALAAFCANIAGAPYIAVDTEFLRERTYYAQLCLIQVAYGPHSAAIDTLAPGLDLTPLRTLLTDPNVIKVFHACSQDLEIFFQRFGAVPGPVFDTQIAASACGHGEQVGYAALVREIVGLELDKSSQATNWSLRPLQPKQVTYAIGDVTHLCVVYERLMVDLDRTGRHAWIAEDMTGLLDASRYAVNPDMSWRRIRIRGADRRALAIARSVAAWRERTAMSRDLPRPWVLHDDAIAEIALNAPEDREQLGRVRALKDGFARGGDGQAVLTAIRQALSEPQDQWPALPERRAPIRGHEALVTLLQALLRLRCEANDVAMNMVASREDLDRLATEEAPDVLALKGWRRAIFGADALALREGRLALTCTAGSVTAIPLG